VLSSSSKAESSKACKNTSGAPLAISILCRCCCQPKTIFSGRYEGKVQFKNHACEILEDNAMEFDVEAHTNGEITAQIKTKDNAFCDTMSTSRLAQGGHKCGFAMVSLRK
jgi:hypothetical protein